MTTNVRYAVSKPARTLNEQYMMPSENDSGSTKMQTQHTDHCETVPKAKANETNCINDGPILDDHWHAVSRSLVRKLDLTLMPMIWVLYLFNYLDRNSISSANLNSIKEDLSLSGEDFNTVVSILNVGQHILILNSYMAMQILSNMILTRVRPSLYIPLWACAWSIVSASTGAVQNFGQLITVRCLLGIAEAPFFPGVYYLLSCWYTRKELGLRMAFMYTGLIVAIAFSGLIAAGVFSRLDHALGLAGWRWLYIIVGSVNFLLAVASMFLLPDFPEAATGSQRWLLSEEEQKVALERIAADSVTQESNRSLLYGLRLAVSDRRTWAFVMLLLCNHAAFGFSYFFPSIVKGFGFGSTIVTLLCTSPPYLVGAVMSVVVSWSSDSRGERGYHIAVPAYIAAAGFIVSVATLNGPTRYAASFLYVSGCYAANGLIYGWAANVLNQTPEKKAVATSMLNVLAQLGNIISPYFFREQDEPRYLLAMFLLIGFSAASGCISLGLKWDLRRANRLITDAAVATGQQPRFFAT
ncbi:hypothetical protein PFICI_09602 [Pestalotiopsis fici W106-1]|uniref:Major facilitator superfamily (MFS) profile domain-containing protein n=1 Tax=Pestalotiopsis fici (strain W106-1 / CGMCC3.15140) TaxID=1229662 RepID=W3X171_PESFW|nr:uncharacterized protein PFICI_09602 [Pestalotiopsis fici W106-1]ETS79749.1 hypothetical protein PFICI_09602 [Pestalotiopsis fici W106-1]